MMVNANKGGKRMETNKVIVSEIPSEEESYRSAFFVTLILVGGTIIATIILLLALFIVRI